jgi:hypothetical protein
MIVLQVAKSVKAPEQEDYRAKKFPTEKSDKKGRIISKCKTKARQGDSFIAPYCYLNLVNKSAI